MESWRNEFYGSDYGSQYLMHYRTKGSRNGVSRTEGYRAIGSLAKGILPSVTKTSTTANRPVSRPRDVAPNTTGTVGRRGEPLPLGTTAGEFTIGKDGLYESYAKNRPTTPPAGKTAEEPKPNGLTTEQAAKLEEQSEREKEAAYNSQTNSYPTQMTQQAVQSISSTPVSQAQKMSGFAKVKSFVNNLVNRLTSSVSNLFKKKSAKTTTSSPHFTFDPKSGKTIYTRGG